MFGPISQTIDADSVWDLFLEMRFWYATLKQRVVMVGNFDI